MRLRELSGVVAGMCVLAALCLLVVAAGCGGGGSSNASAEGSEGAIPKSAPKLEVPEGLPPKKLIIKDLHKGTGAEAKMGDMVKIQYYGIIWGSGVEHSNSWRYSHIPVFRLGSHTLLRAFNIAIPGMKEGGSRELIIPHNYVFYPSEHQHLGRLEALIYRVYLVKIVDDSGR